MQQAIKDVKTGFDEMASDLKQTEDIINKNKLEISSIKEDQTKINTQLKGMTDNLNKMREDASSFRKDIDAIRTLIKQTSDLALEVKASKDAASVKPVEDSSADKVTKENIL